MKQEKRYLTLSENELKFVFFTLIRFKNKLITQGRYTDAVDDVILKLDKTSRKVTTI